MANNWVRLDRLLIELWADFTIPARVIGERLGVTKNAAIGRAHARGRGGSAFRARRPRARRA